jgi:hypothetical protein
MGTSDDLHPEHVGKIDIGGKTQLAGRLLDAVNWRNRFSNRE